MLKLRAVPLLLALAIGACQNAPTEIRTARVHVSKVVDGIRIENLTDKGMGYFLVDQTVIPVLFWAPCTTTTPDCLRLPAHSAVTVKFADIALYSTSTKSVAPGRRSKAPARRTGASTASRARSCLGR